MQAIPEQPSGGDLRLISCSHRNLSVLKPLLRQFWWYSPNDVDSLQHNPNIISALTKVLDGKVATTPAIQTARV